jgi:hypothetical protein
MALLSWVQEKIPEKNIKDFTSDWKDGTALCALTNAIGKDFGLQPRRVVPPNS